MAARGTRATERLSSLGIAYAVHPYPTSPHGPAHHGGPPESYGEEAAAALGVAPEQVFKTLVAVVDGSLVVGVVPVTGHLDLKALAHAVGGKRADMAPPADAERATGYVVGGISPIAQRRRLPVVVDDSVLGYPTVYCSAGQRGLQVELAPADLILACGASVAPIARPSR